MSNRAAGGEKRVKECGQALFIDRDAFSASNSACSSPYENNSSWVSLFMYLWQLFCTLPFINEDRAAGTACGFHTKTFSKQLMGPAPYWGEIYGLLSEDSFFQENKGEHIKMKFETGNLRSCTDEDDDKNANYEMRAVTTYRQRSRPLSSGGLNAIRTRRYDPLLSRSNTAIGEVYQMKDRSSLSTALAVSTSSAPYLCLSGAERRGCT